MAITVADIQTSLNTYIGDASTDRISAAERLNFITEATMWLMEETNNDHMNASYSFDYFDSVHAYKLTTAVPDILGLVDLTRSEDDHSSPFTYISPRELKLNIANGFGASEYALERKDSNWYLLVNHDSKYTSVPISSFEATDDGGGEWEADTTDSDANNVTIGNTLFTDGAYSLNFDVTVAQSGNNRATIFNEDLDELDLSDYVDLGSFIVEIYIPETTDFTSVTFYWGSSSSAYWSKTVTTDINGNAFTEGTWNTLRFEWASATMTSTPDEDAINYMRFDFNYAAGYDDDTDFRIDELRLVRPETLTFLYTSSNVGTDTNGTDIKKFGATTDIPYFSGQYDNLKYAVAHKAAALAFRSLRLKTEAKDEDLEAARALERVQNIIPSSVDKENKTFRVAGINFRRSKGRRR